MGQIQSGVNELALGAIRGAVAKTVKEQEDRNQANIKNQKEAVAIVRQELGLDNKQEQSASQSTTQTQQATKIDEDYDISNFESLLNLGFEPSEAWMIAKSNRDKLMRFPVSHNYDTTKAMLSTANTKKEVTAKSIINKQFKQRLNQAKKGGKK